MPEQNKAIANKQSSLSVSSKWRDNRIMNLHSIIHDELDVLLVETCVNVIFIGTICSVKNAC